VFKATSLLDYARETDMLPTVQDAGWASVRVVKIPKNLNLTGIRNPLRMVEALWIKTSSYAVARYRPSFARLDSRNGRGTLNKNQPVAVARYRPSFACLDSENFTEIIKMNSAISHKSESRTYIYITMKQSTLGAEYSTCTVCSKPY
jgi:hypothetical protein